MRTESMNAFEAIDFPKHKKTVKGFLKNRVLDCLFFVKNSLKHKASSLKNLDTQKNVMYNIPILHSVHSAREK